MTTGVEDSIGRMGADHQAQQGWTAGGNPSGSCGHHNHSGGGPSGHCGHSTHADEEFRRLDDIGRRLDHIEEMEIDQVAEMNNFELLLSQVKDSMARILKRIRRR